MPKIVYLNEARQISLSTDYEHIMLLNPGRNIVDDKIFDAVSQEDAFKDAVADDRIVVQGDKLDIVKMDVRKALRTIDLETTVSGVQELLDQETSAPKPRTNIMEAATQKITSITEALALKAKEKKAASEKDAGGGDNA